jgi:hypothetical protein
VFASSAAPSPVAASQGGELFDGAVESIGPTLRDRMVGLSWHEGCPVPIRKLRLLAFNYWAFDGLVHRGRLVVHRTQAVEVLGVFEALFDAAFPLKRVRLVERYGADDELLGRRNVTSAFNCRFATGNPGVWSQHAYGLAVDINPVQNPYVTTDGFVRNLKARRYLDRSKRLSGMIHRGDVVVRSFAAIGWSWGGDWSGGKDYMHFSRSGG